MTPSLLKVTPLILFYNEVAAIPSFLSFSHYICMFLFKLITNKFFQNSHNQSLRRISSPCAPSNQPYVQYDLSTISPRVHVLDEHLDTDFLAR